MLSSLAFTLISGPSSYSAYLLGNRLFPSSGIRQIPPPTANDRPQWQYSFASFEILTIVCLQESHGDLPLSLSSKSRMSWTPVFSSRWLFSRAEYSPLISVVHSSEKIFGCDG